MTLRGRERLCTVDPWKEWYWLRATTLTYTRTSRDSHSLAPSHFTSSHLSLSAQTGRNLAIERSTALCAHFTAPPSVHRLSILQVYTTQATYCLSCVGYSVMRSKLRTSPRYNGNQ